MNIYMQADDDMMNDDATVATPAEPKEEGEE